MSTGESQHLCQSQYWFLLTTFLHRNRGFLSRLGHSALRARHLECCVMRLWVCERTVHCGFRRWRSRRGSGSQSLSVGCGFSQLGLQSLSTDFLFWAQWSEKGTRFTLSFASLRELQIKGSFLHLSQHAHSGSMHSSQASSLHSVGGVRVKYVNLILSGTGISSLYLDFINFANEMVFLFTSSIVKCFPGTKLNFTHTHTHDIYL